MPCDRRVRIISRTRTRLASSNQFQMRVILSETDFFWASLKKRSRSVSAATETLKKTTKLASMRLIPGNSGPPAYHNDRLLRPGSVVHYRVLARHSARH